MGKYWFKRKRYGWGWTPVTWQGAAVIFGYIFMLLLGLMLTLNMTHTPVDDVLYSVMVIAASVALVQVTKEHAPPARWRWGRKPHDKFDEDI